MTTKKIAIGAKPTRTASVDPDTWVESRGAMPEPAPESQKPAMKRLTIDIPEDLHRQIKAACAMRGTKIADEVRLLLMEKYRNKG